MAAAVSIQGLTKKYLDVWNKAEIVEYPNQQLKEREFPDLLLQTKFL